MVDACCRHTVKIYDSVAWVCSLLFASAPDILDLVLCLKQLNAVIGGTQLFLAAASGFGSLRVPFYCIRHIVDRQRLHCEKYLFTAVQGLKMFLSLLALCQDLVSLC